MEDIIRREGHVVWRWPCAEGPGAKRRKPLLVDPENEDLMIAFPEAERKVQKKEAQKLPAKSRTVRDY